MPARKILFIDDDPGVLKTAELFLLKLGYDFRQALNPAEAYGILSAEPVDVILLDLNFSRAQMSGEEGLACLREILRHDPHAVVIVVTGHSGLTIAVQALRAGAKNFVMKPWNNARLLEAIEEAIAQRGNPQPPELADGLATLDAGVIVGACDALVRTRELITKYAPLTASVLLMGESGTGKSLVAQALHRQSLRSDVKILQAASLTLADVSDLANITNATLVLEDIDGLAPDLTQALLAALADASRRNTRFVATTSRHHMEIGLQKALLYALSTLEMVLPPLRDRGHDIDLLSHHFARVFALRQGLGARSLAPDAIIALRGYAWPDNLHALRRVVERALVACDGPVATAADLDLPSGTATPDLGLNLERTERLVIEEALSRHNFNISKAAMELGLTRQTLYRRMARHGL
ncbi:Transcriptional regulatory protein ZraR (plasmid) [Asticcacaulis sp. MM231]|uniref:sigma-54-dependent transcriptional regulator n=1 Tax=Asticcacaulis sp. MM231 TaxID=3157666 RepID=UPI0032D5A96C